MAFIAQQHGGAAIATVERGVRSIDCRSSRIFRLSAWCIFVRWRHSRLSAFPANYVRARACNRNCSHAQDQHHSFDVEEEASCEAQRQQCQRTQCKTRSSLEKHLELQVLRRACFFCFGLATCCKAELYAPCSKYFIETVDNQPLLSCSMRTCHYYQ